VTTYAAGLAPGPSELVSTAVTNTGFQLPVPAPNGLAGVLWQRFDPPAQNWLAGHRGVDLLASPGSAVYSPAPGTVTFSGKVAGKPVVTVTHADGLRSTFEPVIGIHSVGTAVAAGSPIGTVGFWPAGTASHCPDSPLGACVHWGVRRGDLYLDPLSLLGKAPPIVLLPL